MAWFFGGFLVPEMRRTKKSVRWEMVEKRSLLEAAGFLVLLQKFVEIWTFTDLEKIIEIREIPEYSHLLHC